MARAYSKRVEERGERKKKCSIPFHSDANGNYATTPLCACVDPREENMGEGRASFHKYYPRCDSISYSSYWTWRGGQLVSINSSRSEIDEPCREFAIRGRMNEIEIIFLGKLRRNESEVALSWMKRKRIENARTFLSHRFYKCTCNISFSKKN